MKWKSRDEIKIVWDRSLKPGSICPHPILPDTLVVGVGTSLDEIVFRANLTVNDRQFLRLIKIGAD